MKYCVLQLSNKDVALNLKDTSVVSHISCFSSNRLTFQSELHPNVHLFFSLSPRGSWLNFWELETDLLLGFMYNVLLSMFLD